MLSVLLMYLRNVVTLQLPVKTDENDKCTQCLQ